MRRSHRRMTIVSSFLVLGVALTLMAQDGMPGVRGADGGARTTAFLANGLTTLYALDPIARSMSFSDGAYGGAIQDHMAKNRNSDIEFGSYAKDAFTVGIEGGRMGAIVDLGTADELSRGYGFRETIGGGQAFASIRFVDDELHILADYDTQETRPLEEAKWLVPVKSASAAAHAGHIYLARLHDRHDEQFDLVVKFMVVEHRPDESVAIRWQRLR